MPFCPHWLRVHQERPSHLAMRAAAIHWPDACAVQQMVSTGWRHRSKHCHRKLQFACSQPAKPTGVARSHTMRCPSVHSTQCHPLATSHNRSLETGTLVISFFQYTIHSSLMTSYLRNSILVKFFQSARKQQKQKNSDSREAITNVDIPARKLLAM